MTQSIFYINIGTGKKRKLCMLNLIFGEASFWPVQSFWRNSTAANRSGIIEIMDIIKSED
jgi:hypothetical protein